LGSARPSQPRTLLNRPEWRDSDVGPAIATAVTAALYDANPVVRMQAAARPTRCMPTPPQPTALGEMLLAEQRIDVRAGFLNRLTADIAGAPATADAVLTRFVDADPGRQVTGILTHLTLVQQTADSIDRRNVAGHDDLTAASKSSAGVSQPRVLRGRLLMRS
jgi:hypothetical protein